MDTDIYVIGDSISMQYGPYLERALRGVCGYARKEGTEEALANLDMPAGANGGDSDRVRAYVEAMAERGNAHPSLLLINCGLHDIKGEPTSGRLAVDEARYRDNLGAIVAAGRQWCDTFIWVRTTPVDDAKHAQRGCGFTRTQSDVERYNMIADEVMRTHDVPDIDLHGFTDRLRDADDPAAIFRDGVHFTDAVQAQQGAFLAGWIVGRLQAAASPAAR